FQSHDWLSAWAKTAAAQSGETALIVSARSADGRLQVLLPLGITRVAGQPVAGFLGQSHANYGLALVEPQIAERLTAADVRGLFRAIAGSVQLTAVRLDRQPAIWNGRPNPFATAGGIVSANDSHVLPMTQPFDEMVAGRFSARTRSTLRRKARKLAGLGGYRITQAGDTARRMELIALFLAAKSRQLRDGGIPDVFGDPGVVAFYRALAGQTPGSPQGIMITALEAGGMIGAIALTIDDGDRRYLLNAALMDENLRESSPGLLLLTGDIEDACAAGRTHYDLGPGAAAYKSAWTPELIPLVTTIFPLSSAGAPLTAWMTAAALAKRTIKRNPTLWSLARNSRRSLFGTGMIGAGNGALRPR
ncbi:MAG: GNAT family N-acetyltransferase, partial [Hyphomicrobium sp.]